MLCLESLIRQCAGTSDWRPAGAHLEVVGAWYRALGMLEHCCRDTGTAPPRPPSPYWACRGYSCWPSLQQVQHCHVSRVTCHVVPPDGALVDVLRLPGGRVHGAGGRGWQRPALDGGDGGARQHRGDTLPCNITSSHHILTVLLYILFVVEPG